MGDSGSLALGFIISWLAIELSQSQSASSGLLSPALMAWVLAVPVFDAIALFAYRLCTGKPVFEGDRNHFHYWVYDQGVPLNKTVNLLHTITLIMSAVGVIFLVLLEWAPAYLMPIWAALLALHIIIKFGALEKLWAKIIQAY